MYADDGVDEIAQEAGREDGVLLDEFGEIVKPRSYGEGEEAEAQEEAYVAQEGKDPHDGAVAKGSDEVYYSWQHS